MAFVGEVVRVFDEINLYIASHSCIDLVFLVIGKVLFCHSSVL